MKICNPVRRAAYVIALSACAATPAFAGESGFYLGVNVGQSTYDVNEADLAIFPIVTESNVEDSGRAYSLTFGYRFMPYLGVELSLNDFGDLEKTETGFTTLSPSVVGGIADVAIGTRGAALAVIGTLPLQKFELFAKVGAMRAETTGRGRLNSTFGTLPTTGVGGLLPTGNSSASSKSTTALYGVGVGYTVGESLFLKLEWTAVPKVSEEDDDIGLDADVSIISLGFHYRF